MTPPDLFTAPLPAHPAQTQLSIQTRSSRTAPHPPPLSPPSAPLHVLYLLPEEPSPTSWTCSSLFCPSFPWNTLKPIPTPPQAELGAQSLGILGNLSTPSPGPPQAWIRRVYLCLCLPPIHKTEQRVATSCVFLLISLSKEMSLAHMLDRLKASCTYSWWKWKSDSVVSDFVTPWTIQSRGFSRSEYWSG